MSFNFSQQPTASALAAPSSSSASTPNTKTNNNNNNKRKNSTTNEKKVVAFSASSGGGGGGASFRKPPGPDAVAIPSSPMTKENHQHRTNSSLIMVSSEGDDDDHHSSVSSGGDNEQKRSTTIHSTTQQSPEYYQQAESMVSDVLSDGTGESSESGALSGISGSSGGSHTTMSKSLKSTIPLGMSMPQLMIIVISVPVLLLLIYSLIPTTEAGRAVSFFEEHKDVFGYIRDAGTVSASEYLNASAIRNLSLNETSGPTYQRYYDGMMLSRNRFDAYIMAARTIMRESSLGDRITFQNDLDGIIEDVKVQREKIDSRTIRGIEYRASIVTIINRLTRLLLYFAADTRGELLRPRVMNYALIRRTQNLISSMVASASNLIASGRRGFYDTEDAAVLRSRFDSTQGDIQYLRDSTDPNVAAMITRFDRSTRWNEWVETVGLLLSGDITQFANLTEADIVERSTEVNLFILQIDAVVLESIEDGRLLNAVIRDELIKMIIAVIACIIALILVIHYNNKEKTRLEKALDSTAVLAAAVQRFVPKNQLKTMGVRSITQVTPGMSTEVAQTITFTDIRGFTRLSESMSRLELFDWLQNYVARMTKVVSEEKSYIMAFLGDGLGICSPQPTNAVNAAIKMHQSVEEMNLEIVANNKNILVKIGVGIHAGVVVAGVFGDANRLTCTMIAPDVNFASRLEALTKSFGVKILASSSTIDQISPDVFSCRHVGKVQVSGSQKPVSVYDIYQIDTLKDKEFKNATKDDFERAVSLIDSDPPLSDKLFDQISLQAKMSGVHDGSTEMYIRRSRNNNSGASPQGSPLYGGGGAISGQSSVLSFEKDGELKQSSSQNLMPGSMNFPNLNTSPNQDVFAGTTDSSQEVIPHNNHLFAAATAASNSRKNSAHNNNTNKVTVSHQQQRYSPRQQQDILHTLLPPPQNSGSIATTEAASHPATRVQSSSSHHQLKLIPSSEEEGNSSSGERTTSNNNNNVLTAEIHRQFQQQRRTVPENYFANDDESDSLPHQNSDDHHHQQQHQRLHYDDNNDKDSEHDYDEEKRSSSPPAGRNKSFGTVEQINDDKNNKKSPSASSTRKIRRRHHHQEQHPQSSGTTIMSSLNSGLTNNVQESASASSRATPFHNQSTSTVAPPPSPPLA